MYRCRCIDVDAERHVIISMMVMCNDNFIVIIEHDERRLGLPDASVVKEHDNDRTEM